MLDTLKHKKKLAIYKEALGEKLASGKYVLVEPNPEWIRDSPVCFR